MDDRLARWRTRLADLPSLALPTDYPRPSTDSSKLVEATQTAHLSDRLALGVARLALYDDTEEIDDGIDDSLENSPPPTSATPFHLLLAAFTVLLHRFTGDTDLLIATSSANRSSRGEPLLLRVKCDPADGFWELVRRLQFLEAEAEADAVPYDQLVRALAKEEGTGPLFRVRFFDESDKDRTEKHFMDATSSTSDMTVYISTSSTSTSSPTRSSSGDDSIANSRSSLVPSISVRLLYNALLFSQARITQVLEQISLVLSIVVAKPLSPIGQINLITASQRKTLPDPRSDLEWNGFRGAITDMFSDHADRTPERTCIVEDLSQSASRTFTYQQIDHASNVLAHALMAGGVEREDVVTVYSTRNADLVIAVLGIQKAGATFSVIGELAATILHII